MADIKIAFAQIIDGYEGFYSNDAKDSGGETVWGIARNKDVTAPIWPLVDQYKKKAGFPNNFRNDAKIRAIAADYYKKNYWDVHGLDKVTNQRIATELFDISVNMGTGIAGQFLQRSLNVLNREGKDYPDLTIDGKIGDRTIAILNGHKTPFKVLLCLNSLQGAKYIAICENKGTQEAFMNGWIDRVQLN
jgi:lysozyme family protein